MIELQRRAPNARVVYCSATGVSEVGNMAYMRRLGFWGRGTPFSDAKAFIDAMKHRGVGFLEMLAMEMKASGKYVSRGLSFRQAEFCAVETALDPRQRAAYDACADFVAKLKACLAQALAETRSSATRAGATWKAYLSGRTSPRATLEHRTAIKILSNSRQIRAKINISQNFCDNL